jgi:hypothetical protein
MEKPMTTIQACVNPRLLTKASRLFTGTLEGRIIELLQNARRAGATQVEITNSNGLVTVQDNGQGIDDFAKLLDLGGSGWDEDFEASEDPAGVGLFCLAPRAVTIRSHGQIVSIASDGWTGTPSRWAPIRTRSQEPSSSSKTTSGPAPWSARWRSSPG